VATIKDVAERAGVSPSTVSYALSGKRPISEAARQRVTEAIAALDFTPSALGRGLRRGRSQTIGVVYPHPQFSDTGGMEFFSAAASEVNLASYGLSLYSLPSTPRQVLDLFRNSVVDGLMLMEITRHDPRVEVLRATGFPFVLIGRCEDTSGLSLVDFDFELAAFLAVEHLVELGHRRIGWVDDPDRAQDLGYIQYLDRGYERACAELDVTLVRSGPAPSGYAAAERLLNLAPDLSAVLAPCGSSQIGVLRALQHSGRRVPQDCSLVCITTEQLAEWSSPSLTSVDVPLAAMGRAGADLMLRRLAGDRQAEQLIMPAQLVVRESAAIAPYGSGRNR
jgi:DNA-binding LacI/PurR family transcriptional regulator